MAGAGVAAVAIAGTTVLGSTFAATLPTPSATPATVIAAQQYQHERQADTISRDTERLTPAPTPTGMVTSTPTPTPPPVPVGLDEQQSTQHPPAATTTAPSAGETGTGGGLPSLLLTIRANESGGDYTAFNPTGCEGAGCGGAYQLHAGYASEWAAEAGYPGMPSNAALWPPEIQDAVALYKFNQTGGGLWCDWVDYC